jgi:hypothetical protein
MMRRETEHSPSITLWGGITGKRFEHRDFGFECSQPRYSFEVGPHELKEFERGLFSSRISEDALTIALNSNSGRAERHLKEVYKLWRQIICSQTLSIHLCELEKNSAASSIGTRRRRARIYFG